MFSQDFFAAFLSQAGTVVMLFAFPNVLQQLHDLSAGCSPDCLLPVSSESDVGASAML
jgi:hypothetical protein